MSEIFTGLQRIELPNCTGMLMVHETRVCTLAGVSKDIISPVLMSLMDHTGRFLSTTLAICIASKNLRRSNVFVAWIR